MNPIVIKAVPLVVPKSIAAMQVGPYQYLLPELLLSMFLDNGSVKLKIIRRDGTEPSKEDMEEVDEFLAFMKMTPVGAVQ